MPKIEKMQGDWNFGEAGNGQDKNILILTETTREIQEKA
jgi:hypothetical protein